VLYPYRLFLFVLVRLLAEHEGLLRNALHFLGGHGTDLSLDFGWIKDLPVAQQRLAHPDHLVGRALQLRTQVRRKLNHNRIEKILSSSRHYADIRNTG
jgi:hypothetical protein